MLLLLTGGVIGAVVIPTVLGIRQIEEEIKLQESEIERQYTLRNYVRRTFSELSTAEIQLDTIRHTYIYEGEELNFIQALEEAARMSGITQTISLNTESATEITLWDKMIPIKIKVSGPFPSVMSWLNEIEHLDYYVIFNSFNINSTQTAGGIMGATGNVNALFSGNVYWISKDAPYHLDLDRSLNLPPESTTKEEIAT